MIDYRNVCVMSFCVMHHTVAMISVYHSVYLVYVSISVCNCIVQSVKFG